MNEAIEDYLLSFHRTDLLQILENDDISQHFSLNIDFILLYERKPDSVVKLLNEPDKCLDEWDRAALRAQMTLFKEADQKCHLKNNVHCRIFHLPPWPAVRRPTFPGNRDVGKFFQLSGTVMRVTSPKLLEFQRNYVCVKCKTPIEVKAEYDRKYMIKQPKKCENADGCGSTNLVTFGVLGSENCKDYQEIRIQEQVKQIGMGSMPDVMCVTLEDDSVDSCKPGDNVTICGVLRRRWGEFSKGKTVEIDLAFKANHVQVDNSSASMTVSTPEIAQLFDTFWDKYKGNPLEGRDVILKSFCTQIYGLYLVKLAVAIVLAGGGHQPAPPAAETTSTGFRTRSESHLLLVGDPGTGKSQLLRFAAKIIPRSVLTTGVGSTAAGLTVTATMEQREWHLEGGALVMADGGICCIDEFNSMREHDRTSIHEAMEQQTISVAKAGIVAKLNTRCSILAACNPKGNLDPTQTLSMNIALPSPLLSRFDLILMLRDVVDQEWDEQVADYILNGGHNFSKLTDSGSWTVDVLQSYFVTIKKLQPKLTADAEMILSAYYRMQRAIDNRNKARTTVRLLESLVRLSRGHARLMFHDKIEIVDSVYAIVLADTAMDRDSAILNLNNITMNSVFPERPALDYRTMLEAVLTRLRLEEILEKELKSIAEMNYGPVESRFFRNIPNNESANYQSHKTDSTTNKPNKVADNDDEARDTVEGYDTASFVSQPGPSNSKHQANTAKKTLRTNETDFFDTDVVDCDEDNFFDLKVDGEFSRKGKSKSDGKKTKSTGGKKPTKSLEDARKDDTDSGSGPSGVKTKATIAKTIETISSDIDIDNSDEGSRDRSKRPKDRGDLTCRNSCGVVSPDHQRRSKKPKTNATENSAIEVRNVDDISIANSTRNSVKDKLKRFEFVRRREESQDESRGEIAGRVAGSSDDVEKKTSRPEGSADCVQNDLEMLKYMPGVNDDFNIDLNFDWNNFDGQSRGSSEKNAKSVSKTSSMFESAEDDFEISDLDI